MAIRNEREPKPKFPMLSAFGPDGELEDGLTDSHRPVLSSALVKEGKPGAAPLMLLEPTTEPRGMAWVFSAQAKRPVVRRAGRFLDRMSQWVDPRIANEEIGDAMERIERLARAGAPAWVLYALMGASGFWVLAHAVQDFFRRRF